MSNKPSYFSILTAAVRYDKNLCANAKLLYSEITALTQKEGYCWASNQYFSDLYEVDVSTVKRWISDLEKNGHIEIDTEKKGMGWDRKIYSKNVHEGSKRSLTKARNKALRGLENEPITKQDVNKKENNDGVDVPTCLKETGIPLELQIKLAKKYGDDPKRIENACAAVSKMKPRNMEATIQSALEGSYTPPKDKEDIANDNKVWTERNLTKYDNQQVGLLRCDITPVGLEFSGTGASSTRTFSYDDVEFKEKVTKLMNKLIQG